MTATAPAVLVYNPISGHGHLDSWNALFVALLLEGGWRVLALTPDSGALLKRLSQKGLGSHDALQVLDWASDRHPLINFLNGSWQRWERFGDMYFYRRLGSETSRDLSTGERWKRRIFQVTIPFLFRASYFLYSRYLRVMRAGSAVLKEGQSQGECPVVMSRRVKRALGKAKYSPSIAFNMYMDTYTTDQARWREFGEMNELLWAGIRFVPPAAPHDPWYNIPRWQGMCVLDEDVCRSYARALPDKLFEYLPDITETGVPNQPTPIVDEIRRRADGRKIVFLGGSIGGQKNLAQWFHLITLANPKEWFFVQLGEIHRNTLTNDDISALDNALATPPENLLLRNEYLADEQIFNEVIAASHVIFAVYREFRISSNMLGKAAHFRKPIIVSDRYLLRKRVEKYGIGYAVDEDDAYSILSGLVRAIKDPLAIEGFNRYCADFSVKELALRLENFLSNCSELRIS